MGRCMHIMRILLGVEEGGRGEDGDEVEVEVEG